MFSMQIRPEVLAKLREQYPEGCTVVLERMCDPYREMPVGMTGKVIHVDDAGRHPCGLEQRVHTGRASWHRPHSQNRLSIGTSAAPDGGGVLSCRKGGFP